MYRAFRHTSFFWGKIIAFTLVGIAECIPLLFLLHFYFGLSFVGDPSSFLVATVLYAFCVASFGTMVGAAIPALSFENLFARNPCTSVLRLGFQAEILSVPLFGNLVDHFPGDWIFLLWTPLS